MHGSNIPQVKARATSGAGRQERVCWEGEEEPLSLLPAGAVPGQCRQPVSHWQGSSAWRVSAGPLYPGALACPGLSSRFPVTHSAPHPVALSAEDLTDKSGLELPQSERTGVLRGNMRLGRWQWPQTFHTRKSRPA